LGRKRQLNDKQDETRTELMQPKRPTPNDIANINYQDIYENIFKVIITI